VNLHPGAAVAIAMLTADELGVARLMASGDLVSPQQYHNITLYNMRVTGTGISYRAALNEFVYRRPENYLTPEFLARVMGLPVIWLHPKKNLLDSKEYGERVVGSVMLPFIRGDEVWAVCRIYDAGAIEEMGEEQWSTSPAVLLEGSTKLEMENGDHLLLEDKPKLIDHLAICQRGVWDKEGPPTGVETEASIRGDSAMADTETEKKAREDAAAKADAARADADKRMDEKLDLALKGIADATSCMKDVMKRQDAIEEREKTRDDAAKKDADEMEKAEKEKADKAKRDAEDPEKKAEAERLTADKAKKDAEDEEAKKKADAGRADSGEVGTLRAKLAEHEKTIKELAARPVPAHVSDAEFETMSGIQSRADAVMIMLGKRASRPMLGETPMAYRRRLAAGLKGLSPTWKDIPLESLRDDAFTGAVEDTIYADAAVAARSPMDLDAGTIRAVTQTLPSGHVETRFMGRDTHFVRQFSRPVQRARILDPRARHH
jgi:chemotaxis protein histidine kinase CheA